MKKTSENRIKITQIGSPVGRPPKQRQALIGLGLNKIRKSVEHVAVPAILGQVRVVQHLVHVEQI